MYKPQFFFALLLIIILFKTNFCYAQGISGRYIIKGIVVDSLAQSPLDFVTIVVISENASLIKTTYTNEDGSFTFDISTKGIYRVQLLYVGYKTYESGAIIIGDKDSINLGKLKMTALSSTLEEIVITGKKPIVLNKGDKIVYNASDDIGNKSGSAADVMRKAPLLTVEPDGEVKMRGNSNIKVLINGMPSGIFTKNLKEALKMIPASSIESIEIITNPSAKYEAEGAAGVINIITKKKMKGSNGSLDLSAGNLEQSGNLVLNTTTKKFNFSLMINASNDRERQTSELQRNSMVGGNSISNLYQQKDATHSNSGGYASFTTEYRIDSLQKMEVAISYWRGQWPEKSGLYNRYRSNTDLTEYNQKSNLNGFYNYYDLSLNYGKKFKRLGQELQFIGLISRSNDKSEYITDQYLLDGTHVFRENSPNVGNTNEWTLQVDYSHPLNKSGENTIETGVKYVGGNSESDYKVFNSQNPVNDSRSDVMSYFQNIFSAYVSANLKTKNEWGFRPGVRFESTTLGADFQRNTPSFDSKFNNFVPSILITKKLNEKQEMKLNYTERIRRPWIWDLNPYVNASDPLNITSGNPKLRPELTRMLELGHAYNVNSDFSLNSSIYINNNSNAIESITTVDTSGVSFTMSQNIAANRRIGANINAFLQLNSKWTLSAGGELFHLKFENKSMNMKNEGMFYTINLNSTYSLPKNFDISFSGDYGNGYITLQGENSANYSYRFTIQKEILKKKGSLTLSVNNIFQKNLIQKSSATTPSFQSNATNAFYNRSISLTFSWQFGRMGSSDNSEKKFSGQDDNKRIRSGN